MAQLVTSVLECLRQKIDVITKLQTAAAEWHEKQVFISTLICIKWIAITILCLSLRSKFRKESIHVLIWLKAAKLTTKFEVSVTSQHRLQVEQFVSRRWELTLLLLHRVAFASAPRSRRSAGCRGRQALRRDETQRGSHAAARNSNGAASRAREGGRHNCMTSRRSTC